METTDHQPDCTSLAGGTCDCEVSPARPLTPFERAAIAALRELDPLRPAGEVVPMGRLVRPSVGGGER